MARRSSVRRRVVEVVNTLPAHLRLSACPAWVDDPALTLRARCDSYNAWLAAFLAWQGSRGDWFDLNDWPGGWDAMNAETPAVPDGPFNPDDI